MAAMVLFRAAIKRGCWFTRMVMTAPMVKIAGLPMPQLLCGQLADGLTMFGFGKSAVPGDKDKYRQDQSFEGNHAHLGPRALHAQFLGAAGRP